MRIIITIGELVDQGRWSTACGVLGMGEWVVSEGQVDRDDELIITTDEAVRIGLVNVNKALPTKEGNE